MGIPGGPTALNADRFCGAWRCARHCRRSAGCAGNRSKETSSLVAPQGERGRPRRRATHPDLGGTEVICTEDEDLPVRIAAGRPINKAIDCLAGQLGADISRTLAPGGKLVVYGALSTHRQSDPTTLTIPLFARSIIYEAKTVRGFFPHWLATCGCREPCHWR
jgi:hypothetical protein